MNYKTIYDLSKQSFWEMQSTYGLVGFLMVLSLISISLVVKRKRHRLHLPGGLVIIVLVFVLFILSWKHYQRVTEMVRQGKTKVAEGMVKNYMAQKKSMVCFESFELAGIRFKYTCQNFGFNVTQSHGGFIEEDRWLRIFYHKKRILKVDALVDRDTLH